MQNSKRDDRSGTLRGRPSRIWVGLLPLVAALLVSLLPLSPLRADTPQPVLVFHQLDLRVENRARADVLWSGNPGDIENAAVGVNGQEVEGATIERLAPDTPQSFIFVVDTSRAASDSGSLDRTKAFLRSWLNQRTDAQVQSQPVAVYAAGAAPAVVLDYSTDRAKQLDAVNRLNGLAGSNPSDSLNSKSAMWGTVSEAAKRASRFDSYQKNIVNISSAGNTAGGVTPAVASGEVLGSRVAFFSVVGPGAKSSETTDSLAVRSGGSTLSVASAEEVDAAIERTLNLIDGGRYRIDVAIPPGQSVGTGSPLTLSVQVAESSSYATANVGAEVTGTSYLSAPVAMEKAGNTLLANPIVLILALVALMAVISLALYTVSTSVFKSNTFSDQLKAYVKPIAKTEAQSEAERNRFVRNAIVQKAAAATERVAEQRGFLGRIEGALERADVNVKTGEFIFFSLLVIPVSMLIGGFIGGPFLFILFGAVAALGPPAILARKADTRRKKFAEQLPGTLQLLSGSLRAGYSLLQGVESVADETPAPMSQELRRVINEIRLGADLVESFDRLAVRMSSQDFSWVSMGVSIQREVGGDLSELLETIAETMTQRARLRREIRTLTAEGRLSALILTALPVVVIAALQVINPDYANILFTTGIGRLILITGLIMLAMGALVMKKIVDIKI